MVPLKQRMKVGRPAFPDYHAAMEDSIAEGEKEWVLPTDTGPYRRIPWPSSDRQRANRCAVDIHRTADGRVVEDWTVTKPLDLFQPMGVIEYTEGGKKSFRIFLPEDVK